MNETTRDPEHANDSSLPVASDAERRIEEIADRYLDQLQSGESPDRHALAAKYPELASSLEKQLTFVEKLYYAARKHRATDYGDTPVEAAAAPAKAETIRLHPAKRSGGYGDAAPPCQRIGRYFVRELLGRGSFGAVYRASDPKLDREVAVKVLDFASSVGTDFAERFHREARIAAQLRHTNIVPVHETGEHEGDPFIVMDFVRGQTLAARLQLGPIPFKEAAEMVRKAAEALDHAHGFGIIHRDVKPSNILLDERGEPQLIDFGLARHSAASASITEQGRILGTLDYMSPEQAQGGAHRADPRTDVYSLGAVLYHLLTRRVPFPTEGPEQTMDSMASHIYRIVHTEPVRPRTLDAAIPRDLETICLKAMAKEPKDRFASAAAFAEELRRWLNDEPLRVRPPTWWECGRRWGRRNRLAARIATAAALLLIVAVTLGSIAWMQSQRAIEEEGLRQKAEALASQEAQFRAEVQARSWLEKARQRVRTPTMGRRTETLALLRRLAESRRGIRDEILGARLDLQVRSVLAEALGVPDFVMAERADLPQWPFTEWRSAMHPSGQRMAIGTLAGPVLWKRGEKLRPPAAPQLGQRPPRLAYSPDGRYLAYAPAEGGLQLWDEDVSRILAVRKPAETDSVLALGFARGGKSLSVCCDKGHVQRLSLPELRNETEWRVDVSSHRITAAAFNAAATRLAVGDEGGQVRLFDADGKLVPPARPGRTEVEALAWSPDSRLVAAGSKDGLVHLWFAHDGIALHKLAFGSIGFKNMQFSPDGRWLLAGNWDGGNVWDVATGEQLLTAYCPGGFTEDGRCFSATRQYGVAFCDVLTPRAIRRLTGHLAAVAKLAWSRDNRRLISLDSRFEVRLWDVDRSSPLDDFPLPAGGFYAENAAVALSDDGCQMAFASGGGKKAYALIRDLPTGKTLGEWQLPGGFENMACAGGNKFVLVREELDETKEQVRTVALELEAGRPLGPTRLIRAGQPGDRRRFLHCGLTPDGRYYWWTGPRLPNDDRRLEVREVATGRLVFNQSGISSAVEPEALLSSDGRHLWVSTGDKIRPGYDLSTNLAAEPVLGRPVAFSPMSRWLVVQDAANDLRPFPALALRRLKEEQAWLEIPFEGADKLGLVSFSENGRYLALGHINGHITLVDIPNITALTRSPSAAGAVPEK